MKYLFHLTLNQANASIDVADALQVRFFLRSRRFAKMTAHNDLASLAKSVCQRLTMGRLPRKMDTPPAQLCCGSEIGKMSPHSLHKTLLMPPPRPFIASPAAIHLADAAVLAATHAAQHPLPTARTDISQYIDYESLSAHHSAPTPSAVSPHAHAFARCRAWPRNAH